MKIATEGPLPTSGITLTTSNLDVVKSSQTILIAVKPDVVAVILREIVQSGALTDAELESKCFISIAAGVSLADIEKAFFFNGNIIKTGVIRVMPNTPCLVGECAAAYALGSYASPSQKATCEAIFNAVGVIQEVPEKLMDAVTGLSGSGPAYVFMFIEALADGGVRAGLPRNVAMQLAAQTVKGAASMILETKQHPGVLKDQVCSPGGTTIAGVQGDTPSCSINDIHSPHTDLPISDYPCLN